MRKRVLDDKEYRRAVRAIIKRDFFPELQRDYHEDDTMTQFETLSAFSAKCISKEDQEFIDSIEKERQKLQSKAPEPKHELPDANPWENNGRCALFYEPRNDIILPPVRSLKAISYSQTRFGDEMRAESGPSIRDFLSDSTTSESESEFEGRSYISRDLFTKSLRVVNRERLERRKKANQLSSKGKELLKSLS